MPLDRGERAGQQVCAAIDVEPAVAGIGPECARRLPDGRRSRGGQLAQLVQVIRAVEDDQHRAAVAGDPAQFPDRGGPVRHVVEHVQGQCHLGRAVGQGQRGRIAGHHAGGGHGVGGHGRAGRRQHPGGQINAEQAPAMAPPGQLGQVQAVPAADVGDHLGAGQPGAIADRGPQVDPRVLELVDRLPRGEVGVGPVLNRGEVLTVDEQAGAIVCHGKLR